VIAHLLLALTTVMVVGRLLGRVMRAAGQPPVVGEVIGGILLGPSLLGWISPAAYHTILPPEVVPTLGAVAELGVILYMFLVGLELNVDRLRGQWSSAAIVAASGMVLPFALGAVLAVTLLAGFMPAGVPRLSFTLFMGVAMSITAFPVLARILSDLGLTQSELGVRALTCAAIADVSAWCVLALVVGVVQASPQRAVFVALLALILVVGVLTAGRLVAVRLIRAADARGAGESAVAVTLAVLLGAAWITHAIGVHAIIGAFLVGAIIPHDSQLARSLRRSFEHLVVILLLPAFFAFTGMRTQIGLVAGAAGWLTCGVIILAATAGKFGGTFAAARATGSSARQAAGLGILMNTRGLMELVVLNIGLELGVISPTLFTMMVVMAIVTTLATAPMLTLLRRHG
jgi:Kef-type K+ transport system membrane component KefB